MVAVVGLEQDAHPRRQENSEIGYRIKRQPFPRDPRPRVSSLTLSILLPKLLLDNSQLGSKPSSRSSSGEYYADHLTYLIVGFRSDGQQALVHVF